MPDFSNDPILAGIAATLDLLGLKPQELQRSIQDGDITATFWLQARENVRGRYDSSEIFGLITIVRDHYMDLGGNVEYSIDYVLGRVSFRLSA